MSDNVDAASAAEAKVPSQAEVHGTLTPYLRVDGALKAADFYKRAFDAEVAAAMPPDDKGRTMHVHLYINGCSLMLSDPYPEQGIPLQEHQGYTLTLSLRTNAIDDWWTRAVDAGCTVVFPLADQFWGDRYGQLRDPFGVTWGLTAPVK